MDDLRKFALDIAATAIRGAPFTEIVKAAEAFHAFLSGADDERVVRPPPPPNNTALGEADQSPAGLHRLKEFYPDDTPTRIVRREDLPSDAA